MHTKGKSQRTRLVFIALIAWSCGEADLTRFEYRELHMGTEARIVLFAPDTATAEFAARTAFARIAQLDSLLSDYRIDSEVSRIAAAAGGPPQPASDDLIRVLALALRLAAETDGAFDPTLGPVTEMWRAARRTGQPPDSAALAEARSRTGWRGVEVDTVARTVRLALPGMRLDLGAIAKGYAVDEALAVLRAREVSRALISFGGEIGAGNPPPGGTGWEIAVGDSTIRLVNAAVSSSGDAEQFVVLDGRRYSHVVDPSSGLGLTDGAGATVIAPSAMLADALATAMTLADPAMRARLAGAYTSVRVLAR
jgi:thiamine biosynthesis lipoprotein